MFRASEWSARPPSAKSAVHGYVDSTEMVRHHFPSLVQVKGRISTRAILKVDSDAKFISPALEKADFIATMTRQDFRDWLDTTVTVESEYLHLHTTATPRLVNVMTAKLKKCKYYDLLSN
jgi:hypothetical protein